MTSEMVEALTPLVRNAIRTRVKCLNEEEVNEVAQEVWLRVLNNKDEVRSLESWLFVVAQNSAVEYIRKEGKKPQTREVNEGDSITLPTQDTEHIRDIVGRVLKGLQKEIMLMLLDGYKYREISRKLALPIGSVSSYILRGRAVLCRQLCSS